ncbi:tetratricopeptide repeat protein [Amycolatopsis keratiniphila]|uniref:Superkiller protein 3 n=1 Tax=Amycolatopsis keratiniphila TaxID=129921 RepID=R4T845_9PSEU|nr:tetratricopeptide repeat protein [Amycolatopsis keratiniphila]AGM07137.1 superkiller protein 3 [Amycolatopsis keratiniphila]
MSAEEQLDPEEWLELGDRLANDDPQRSLLAYQQAAEQGGYWLTYGNALSNSGKIAEAIQAYTLALADDPAIAHRNLGIVYHDDLEDMALAEQHFRQAVEAGDEVSSRLLGEVLVDQDRPQEAIELLESARAGGDPRALVSLGWAYKMTGHLPEAEAAFRAAHDMDLDEETVLYLGNLLQELGRLDEAAALYEQALRAGNDAVLVNLGNVRSEQGRPHEAIAFYREAIASGDNDGWNNLGHTLQHLGHLEEAREAYTTGAELGDTVAAANLRALNEPGYR